MILRSCLLTALLLPGYMCFDPIGTLVGGIVASFVGYKTYLWYGKEVFQDINFCLSECCRNEKIKWSDDFFNKVGRSLYGQHLATDFAPFYLLNHFMKEDPQKPLVLSFNGPTGTGKNFLSKLIAEHFFIKGMKSAHVHLYIATKHFPHADQLHQYREKLKNDVKAATKTCSRSLFIFDEMDKMPAGIIDAIMPYMNHNAKVGGVDYRRNVYIFLSNAGGEEISKVAVTAWEANQGRNTIGMSDIKPIEHTFHETGGLRDSAIVQHNLIDCYIPFLPLEKGHVKKCIIDEITARSVAKRYDKIRNIVDELEYVPPDLQLYSASGCKKISQVIDMYYED